MINLISDTVTKPTVEMLNVMFAAAVGDDVFQADPTINQLQRMAAEMFGMEAALFCPSGTMTNQIAINLHTAALEEMICETTSHVYQSETGGYAFNARVAVKLIEGKNGKITAEQVEAAVNPDYDWKPKSSLVILENTCNIGGGSVYKLSEIEPIAAVCKKHDMALHLDGARLFNALIETKDKTQDYGKIFDSISICLSKGLGSPVGSLLIGNQQFIKKARRLRKALGGGMRQAGYLAAAGIFALENNIERLKIDNNRAKKIGEVLKNCAYVAAVRPVESNIIFFDLIEKISGVEYIEALEKEGILAVNFGPQTIRFVTHLDISEAMMENILAILPRILK